MPLQFISSCFTIICFVLTWSVAPTSQAEEPRKNVGATEGLGHTPHVGTWEGWCDVFPFWGNPQERRRRIKIVLNKDATFVVTHGDGKGFSGGYTISEKGELCGQSKQEDGIKSFIHGTIVRQKLHGSTGVSGFFELGAGFVAERKAPAKKQKAPPILIDSEQVLPRFTETPDISGGTLEVRIKNGQPFPLTVGFRAGQTGRNLWIPSGGLASIQLPAGKFDVFYQYDPEPEALYQGESIVLNYNGVEILIGPAVEAGRTIKKVK